MWWDMDTQLESHKRLLGKWKRWKEGEKESSSFPYKLRVWDLLPGEE
jgi:hypothetical protein